MKPPLPLVPFLLLVCTVATKAQEITLAEAFDAEEATSIVTISGELDWPSAEPLPPLLDQNYWHPVTEDTWDGVDALRVRSPFEGAFYASLHVEFEGPGQVSFWSKTSNFSNVLHYFVHEKGGPLLAFDHLRGSPEWVQSSFTIRQPGTYTLDINLNDIGSGSVEAWLDNLEISKQLPPPAFKELPVMVHVPLETTKTIEVIPDAFGDPTFRWYRNETRLDGETGSSIVLPAQSEPGTVLYQVDVTDPFGTTLSNPISVQYLDFGEADPSLGLVWFARTNQTDDVMPAYTPRLMTSCPHIRPACLRMLIGTSSPRTPTRDRTPFM